MKGKSLFLCLSILLTAGLFLTTGCDDSKSSPEYVGTWVREAPSRADTMLQTIVLSEQAGSLTYDNADAITFNNLAVNNAENQWLSGTVTSAYEASGFSSSDTIYCAYRLQNGKLWIDYKSETITLPEITDTIEDEYTGPFVKQ